MASYDLGGFLKLFLLTFCFRFFFSNLVIEAVKLMTIKNVEVKIDD